MHICNRRTRERQGIQGHSGGATEEPCQRGQRKEGLCNPNYRLCSTETDVYWTVNPNYRLCFIETDVYWTVRDLHLHPHDCYLDTSTLTHV